VAVILLTAVLGLEENKIFIEINYTFHEVGHYHLEADTIRAAMERVKGHCQWIGQI
jgi:hypothetical protein